MNNDVEVCVICDEPTGKAGEPDDSLCFVWKGKQISPLCKECFELLTQLDETGKTTDFERLTMELKI